MIEENQLEYIGRFGKPHGYKGEINLSFSQFEDDEFLKRQFPLILNVEGIYVPFYVKTFRRRGNEGYLVTIDGYESLPAVKMFSNAEIHALRDQVLEVDPEFALAKELQLEGAEVYSSDNILMGVIRYIDDTTDNILATIQTEEGEEVLMPFDLDLIISEEEDDETGKIQYQLNLPYEYFESLRDLNN